MEKLVNLENSVEELENMRFEKQSEISKLNVLLHRKKSELSSITEELGNQRKKMIRKICQFNLDSYKVGDIIKIDDPEYPNFTNTTMDGITIKNSKNKFYSKGLGRTLLSDITIKRVNRVSLTVEYTCELWRGNSQNVTVRIELEKIKRIESNIYEHEQDFEVEKQQVMRDDELKDLLG